MEDRSPLKPKGGLEWGTLGLDCGVNMDARPGGPPAKLCSREGLGDQFRR